MTPAGSSSRRRLADFLGALLLGATLGVMDLLLLKNLLPPPTRLFLGFGMGVSIMLAIAATREMGWVRWPLVGCSGIAGSVLGIHLGGLLP